MGPRNSHRANLVRTGGGQPKIRRPLKTTFDMTTLIFSAGGCPSYPFYSFERGPGALFSWLVTENPSREVATKDHSSSNPLKGNSADLKTKVDVSKVDVKGFPIKRGFAPRKRLLWDSHSGGPKTPFAPSLKHFWTSRDYFGTLTLEQKHLSHPPLSTFGHFGCLDTCTRPAGSQDLLVFYPAPTQRKTLITPDIPRSQIAASNFYDWAKFWAKNWANFLRDIAPRGSTR